MSNAFEDFRSDVKCTNKIDFNALYREDNVRGEQVKQIPSMVSSLRKNGFKPNHPLVVSEKPDGRFLVLCGNRRHEGLEWIAQHAPEEFSSIVPGGKVPCIVHRGLTDSEEILLRNDHSKDEDRVPLDDWSLFLAIKQLLRAWPGDSETRIAEKMGIYSTKGKNAGKPNRSFVQDRVALARLPIFVQEQFRLLWEVGKDVTPVRVAHIKQLKAIFSKEFNTYPDGDGPEFSTKWREIMNPAPESDGTDSDDQQEPKDLKVSAAKDRAMGCNSKLAKRFLLAVTNQGGDAVELDAQIAQAEADSEILADIREYLGLDDYAELVNNSREARLSREAAEAEQSAEAEVL